MPIYEYRCADCERAFSKLQSMGATQDGVRCPHCESDKVERQFSSFASTSASGGDAASPAAPATHSCGFS